MFSTLTQVVMLVTGILLVSAAMATPAIQDLADLRMVIQSAADTIGDSQNPNRGWGFGSRGSQMGTADLINNITSTLLQSKFQIDTNRTAWLNLTEANPALNISTAPPETPTLPIRTSMALPSVLPTSTPSLDNVTVDLSAPYIDYVSAIPNLSASLTSLGRAWHREMNSPVNEAIDVLQESIATLQTTMLEHDLLGSSAVLRTVRASSSLESAQQAWSRFLNLPGSTGTSTPGDETQAPRGKRSNQRLSLGIGRQYTHKELWGRKESSPIGESSQHGGVVEWRMHRGTAHAFRA